MLEIKLDVLRLTHEIQKLRALKGVCENIKVDEVPVEGSGQSVDKLNAIDREYAVLRTAVIRLIENSISFFENTRSSMVSADEKASSKIK